MAPHYEKGSSTNVGMLFIATKSHHGWLHINDVIIVAKSNFAPTPKFFAGCGPAPRHQRFMREEFSKNEISENISQKFHDQWKIE